MHFSRTKPEADGICFDDISLVDDKVRALLIARELVWLTTFTDPKGLTWGGSVIAKDRDEAAKIADARGLGETIFCLCIEFNP